MSRQPSAETFLKDVGLHKVEILLDIGVHRHIKCRSTIHGWNQWFEVVTWPGSLAISGDMGSWVFSRTEDMFRFFRSGELKINPSYWSEKLQVGRDEAKDFSNEAFREDLLEHLSWYGVKGERLSKLTAAIEEDIFSGNESEHELLRAAFEFSHDEVVHGEKCKFQFETSEMPSGKRWTYRFIWCLYAIVWAIQQYDSQHAALEPTPPAMPTGGSHVG